MLSFVAENAAYISIGTSIRYSRFIYSIDNDAGMMMKNGRGGSQVALIRNILPGNTPTTPMMPLGRKVKYALFQSLAALSGQYRSV